MSKKKEGDWYCRNCGYLDSSRVTHSETCDTCHKPVEFHTLEERTELTALRTLLRKYGEFAKDIAEYRLNHIKAAEQAAALLEELRALEGE